MSMNSLLIQFIRLSLFLIAITIIASDPFLLAKISKYIELEIITLSDSESLLLSKIIVWMLLIYFSIGFASLIIYAALSVVTPIISTHIEMKERHRIASELDDLVDKAKRKTK